VHKSTLLTMPGASTGNLPTHPRTGLTAVGIVGGKPVWPIRGGSVDAGGGQPNPPSSDQGGTTPPPPAGQPAAPPQGEPQDVSALPEWAQKIIKDTRTEAAKSRTDKQTAAQAAAAAESQKAAILKALGLADDGTEEVDPSALTAQIDQYKAVAWESSVESHVVRLGQTLGLDADALLDSNSFLNSLGELVDIDPSSGDFRTKLEAHLKTFAASNPTKFKATPAGPARSGGDMSPGAPGTPQARPKSLTDAVKKALGG
jgi:hypothetical protein